MITRKIGLLAVCITLITLAGIIGTDAAEPEPIDAPAIPDYLVQDQITSPSLEGNLLGDPATRDVLVYLPPSYNLLTGKRYPTIYLLHPYMGDQTFYLSTGATAIIKTFYGFDLNTDLGDIVNELMVAGEMTEAIIVMPNAYNVYEGSWYERSEVLGDYRNYIARELVAYIDGKYRTIPDRNHRAIIGHSMGANGAISLAIEYPDVFGATAASGPSDYSITPTILDAFIADNPDEMGTPGPGKMSTNLVYSLAVAYTPDPDNPPYYADIPIQYPEKTVIPELWDMWKERFLTSQIARNGANLSNTPILINQGVGEPVIMAEVPGVDLILAALDAQGIAYTYEEFPGDHLIHLRDRLASMLKFVSAHIAPEVAEDFTSVFFMDLSSGLNMISLPLKPDVPYTARSLAARLSATVVIKYDEATGRFRGFTPGAPGDGFLIEGGKGYIVNTPAGGVIPFVGAAWTNIPPVDMAPPIAQRDSAWAFVVSGSVSDGDDIGGSYTVAVKNLRTGDRFTDVIDPAGYFTAASADLTRNAIVAPGDRLEVTILDSSGNTVSGPFVHNVTLDEIRNAVAKISLKLGCIIPEKTGLLQNYPNPFNPETWIPYQLRDASPVFIRIYSAAGNLIRALDLGRKDAGIYASRSRAAYWDGKNESGETVASGVYFYSLTTGDGFSATRKMIVAK